MNNINKQQVYDVAILGGGAAGMIAGITASRNGAKVLLLEHTNRLGKKILSTGNGKCNITNENQDLLSYRTDDSHFVESVLGKFGYKDTLNFFEQIGVITYSKNGYIYPRSNQASCVLDALRFTLSESGVNIIEDIFIKSIDKQKDKWQLISKKGTYLADKVIFALGGLSAPKTGSDGCGYMLLKGLGHQMKKQLPALCALKCQEDFYKSIAGIRTAASVNLYADGELISSDSGELQLTNYGISGIPVFQISRFAAYALDCGKDTRAVIDFMEEYTLGELRDLLISLFGRLYSREIQELLGGITNKKLGVLLCKLSGIRPSEPAGNISPSQIDALVNHFKHFETVITATMDYDNAQTTAGGIYVSDINPETMESKLQDGIYFAGEMIDVDGKCGGYNLQWAWSTGYIAGLSAAGGKDA